LDGLANLAYVMLYIIFNGLLGYEMGQFGLNKSNFGAPVWIRLSAGAFALCLLLPVIFLPFKIQDAHGLLAYFWSLPLLFYGGRFLASIALTGIGPEQAMWPIESESVATLSVIVWFLGSLFIF